MQEMPQSATLRDSIPIPGLHRRPFDARAARTQATWIWALNFVCFMAHSLMIVLTYWLAYWRHNLDHMSDTTHVMIPIYRIRNVPTQGMLDKNLSRWGDGWNLTSTESNSGLFLYDNGMPASHVPAPSDLHAPTSPRLHSVVLYRHRTVRVMARTVCRLILRAL